MRHVHFVGIGGIGMSALAQMLSERGDTVSGSDREDSPVTEMLEGNGIRVLIPQQAGNVPPGTDLVVYSDAVQADNPERARATELAIPQLSYFEMLGQTADRFDRTIAVAGTNGKTTTTGMLTKILMDAGAKPTAVIGSIVKDFGSNYVAGDDKLFVVEACEYRDHVLQLSPRILIINNIEWDHTDWFPSLEAVQKTFAKAIAKVPPAGAIVTDPTNPNIAPLLEARPEGSAPVIDYTKEPAYALKLPGDFNKMNARAAAAAARLILGPLWHTPSSSQTFDESIAASLASFEGTWRRFDYKGTTAQGAEVYDDYAHHPTAIRETLRALRAKTKGKIFAAFHPHLYSRTRDLLDGFARSFEDADEILIAPIYAAREVDDGTVSNDILAGRIRTNGQRARSATFEEIENILSTEPQAGDVVMTMGAGDIYKVADKLIQNNTKVV